MTEQREGYEIISIQQGATMPAMTVQEAVDRRDKMVRFVQQIMEEDRDYGIVPGTDGKPTLYKPGAEKLTTFFGLTKRFEVLEKAEDWMGKAHNGEPFFYYWYRCQLWRGDLLIAEGDGSCNSMEKKYRYRQASRKCPTCGQETIIKGKEEYGGGWICWTKKGGCGAKFPDGDPAIESQQVGRIINPDIADQVNTIQKMAAKRALVAATLLAVNASEFFTQDLEDMVEGDFTTSEEPKQQKAKSKKNRGNNKTPAGFRPEFLNEHDLTDKDALSTLGPDIGHVNDWLKSNPGKTLVDAEAEILAVSGKV
jgi:hypothetical protein